MKIDNLLFAYCFLKVDINFNSFTSKQSNTFFTSNNLLAKVFFFSKILERKLFLVKCNYFGFYGSLELLPKKLLFTCGWQHSNTWQYTTVHFNLFFLFFFSTRVLVTMKNHYFPFQASSFLTLLRKFRS